MAAAGTPKDDTGLERKMESRHLTMISLGGVIGTGLFLSSGLESSPSQIRLCTATAVLKFSVSFTTRIL